MIKCSTCKVEKTPNCFGKKTSAKNGKQSQCKDCRSLSLKKYRSTDKCKLSQDRYNKSEKGRNTRNINMKRYTAKYSDKAKAHYTLNHAIRDGKIEKPDHCAECFKECSPEGHHWSYLEEHWLDVKWLCKKCHTNLSEKKRGVLSPL